MDKKKQIEHIPIREICFNENLKLLVYQITDYETPDFEVNIDKRWISIEHTRLINPQLQQVENYRDRIIKTAQKRFESKYSDRLYV